MHVFGSANLATAGIVFLNVSMYLSISLMSMRPDPISVWVSLASTHFVGAIASALLLPRILSCSNKLLRRSALACILFSGLLLRFAGSEAVLSDIRLDQLLHFATACPSRLCTPCSTSRSPSPAWGYEAE